MTISAPSLKIQNKQCISLSGILNCKNIKKIQLQPLNKTQLHKHETTTQLSVDVLTIREFSSSITTRIYLTISTCSIAPEKAKKS